MKRVEGDPPLPFAHFQRMEQQVAAVDIHAGVLELDSHEMLHVKLDGETRVSYTPLHDRKPGAVLGAF